MTDFGSALEFVAQSLDISATKYSEAVQHYTAVGQWLDADDSPLKTYRPRVYPQGSFRLGTVVRPVTGGREADYDIDLVCQLHIRKDTATSKGLKHAVGDRLKAHRGYARMLDEEGRRCWTLNYAESDGIGFHLDALPSIPETREFLNGLVAVGVSPEHAQHAIGITERQPDKTYLWVPGGSNPAGYAAWFDDLNAAAASGVAKFQKRNLFEGNRSLYASVQEVPDALVRSPLQRVIQLLKRHRDVRFSGHERESEKPISMVLTTLAARAYQGETDIDAALLGILESIDDFGNTGVIERRGGKWWIPNPVNPAENFADRWNDRGSHRPKTFFDWVQWLRQDLALAEAETATANALAKCFGVSESSLNSKPSSGTLIALTAETVPGLAAASHCQSPPWSMQQQSRVNVTASVHKARGANRLWQLSARSQPKDFWIRFKANTDARAPYEVVWQVVNTGAEAEAAGHGGLRGGFEDGTGDCGGVRWERTAYRGTHWVEAFVIKDGNCVARSGRILVRVR